MEMIDTEAGPDEALAPPDAAASFAALGAEVRLEIVRLLVRAGQGGMPVGALQDQLGIAASTLSHHLKALGQAGLIVQRREGRVLRCHAAYETLAALAAFLMEECCADAGVPCGRTDQ